MSRPKIRYEADGPFPNANNQSGSVPSKGCADIFFINDGTDIARINGVPIAPNLSGLPGGGGSMAFPAFGDEVQEANYRLTFDGLAASTQIVFVVRKFYVQQVSR